MQSWTRHAHQACERQDPCYPLDADLRREPGIVVSNSIGRREIMDRAACGRHFLPAERQRRSDVRAVFDLGTHLRRRIVTPRKRAKLEQILRDSSAIRTQLNPRNGLTLPIETELNAFTHIEELPEIRVQGTQLLEFERVCKFLQRPQHGLHTVDDAAAGRGTTRRYRIHVHRIEVAGYLCERLLVV